MKPEGRTPSGLDKRTGTTSLPEPSGSKRKQTEPYQEIILLTAHVEPAENFFGRTPASNLQLFSSRQGNSTERSIYMVCSVSVQRQGRQLEMFGKPGLAGTALPRWKYLDPKRRCPGTSQNISQSTLKMKPTS